MIRSAESCKSASKEIEKHVKEVFPGKKKSEKEIVITVDRDEETTNWLRVLRRFKKQVK